MKVEATVDVGGNLTSLVERLAQQIGTTADKVFPWYVEQAYLHGVTTLVAIAVALIVFGSLFAVSARFPWVKGNHDAPTPALFIGLASGAALAITVVLTFIDGPRSVRQIMNPHFYAMQTLAEDIGRMRGR